MMSQALQAKVYCKVSLFHLEKLSSNTNECKRLKTRGQKTGIETANSVKPFILQAAFE